MSEELYGRGPAMNALPELRAENAKTQRELAVTDALEAAREYCRKHRLSLIDGDDLAIAQLMVLIEIRGDLAKLANPPMMASGVLRETERTPGRVTYVDVDAFGRFKS